MPSDEILRGFEELRRSTVEVVYIEWLDASGVSSTQSVADAKRERLSLMHSAGVLIGEDDQVLRLALDCWSYDDDGSLKELCRNVSVIPKNAIQRRQHWEVAPPHVAET